MITITPEERGEWRGTLEGLALEHPRKNVLTAEQGLRLLDALDEAENERDELRFINGSDRYDEVVSDLVDCTQEAEARAEKAERDRKNLAAYLSRKSCFSCVVGKSVDMCFAVPRGGDSCINTICNFVAATKQPRRESK